MLLRASRAPALLECCGAMLLLPPTQALLHVSLAAEYCKRGSRMTYTHQVGSLPCNTQEGGKASQTPAVITILTCYLVRNIICSKKDAETLRR